MDEKSERLRRMLRAATYTAWDEARLELTVARLTTIAIGTAILAVLGEQYARNALAFVNALALPGTLWVLWQAAGRAGHARARSTENWLLQSDAPAALLGGAQLAGATAPGLLLVALGLGAATLDGNGAHAHAILAWIVGCAFALAALGAWRHAEEPRTARAFQGRSLVLLLTLTLTLSWTVGEVSRYARALGAEEFAWWGLAWSTSTVFAIGGWGVAACGWWGLARAHALHAQRNARTVPRVLCALLVWGWTFVAGWNAETGPANGIGLAVMLLTLGLVLAPSPWPRFALAQIAACFVAGALAALAWTGGPEPGQTAWRAVTAAMGVAMMAFALPLVQPRTRPSPRHDTVLAGTILFAAAGVVAAATVYWASAQIEWRELVARSAPGAVADFAAGHSGVRIGTWVVATTLYAVRDLAVFAVLHRHLTERPGWIWAAVVLIANLGVTLSLSQAGLPWWTSALAGLPVGHATEGELPANAGAWCALVALIEVAILAWYGWGRKK